MKNLVLLLASLFSVSALAAANYGEAGCGLGSIVMGKDGNQILAATSNGIGFQVFAISSGTSNCDQIGGSAQVPMYIEVNRIALAKDAARGEGETLAGLAQILGCEQKTFGSAVKANYDSLFIKTGMKASGIRTGIEQMVQSNPDQVCGV